MRQIAFKCFGCEKEWVIPVEELRAGISENMTDTCLWCKLSFCGECYDLHECMKQHKGEHKNECETVEEKKGS